MILYVFVEIYFELLFFLLAYFKRVLSLEADVTGSFWKPILNLNMIFFKIHCFDKYWLPHPFQITTMTVHSWLNMFHHRPDWIICLSAFTSLMRELHSFFLFRKSRGQPENSWRRRSSGVQKRFHYIQGFTSQDTFSIIFYNFL